MTNATNVITLALLFAVSAEASTIHVSKAGTNSNSCAQAASLATAKLSIKAGIACLQPGDTLLVHGGTYNEGLRWQDFAVGFSSGTPGNPITWSAAPGEVVVVDGNPATKVSDHEAIVDLYGTKWLTIKGFVFDGRDVMQALLQTNSVNASGQQYPPAGDPFFDPMHIRLEGNEFKRSAINAIFVNSVGVDIVNNHIHDGGHYALESPPFGYCLYSTGSFGLIEGNHCHHYGRYGFQFYSQVGYSHDNIVRNNSIHDNGLDAISAGIVIGGVNQLVQGNTIFANKGPGIDVDYSGARNVQLVGNRIYGNTKEGIVIGADGGAINTTAKDNIIFGNVGTILDRGTGSSLTNNSFVDTGVIPGPAPVPAIPGISPPKNLRHVP